MKIFLTIVLFSLCVAESFSQPFEKFFFNEFGLSVNRANVKDDNTENRTGFGIGAYRSATYTDSDNVNIIFGIEYNQTRQFKRIMYAGHFGSYRNLTYYFDNISLLLGARFSEGTSIKLFAEAHGFLDLIVGARMQGEFDGCIPVNNQINCSSKEVKGNAGISGINPGFALAIGMIIPANKYQFILKPDIKFILHSDKTNMEPIFFGYYRFLLGIKFK